MTEACCDARLALETLGQNLVVRQKIGEYLQRDFSPQVAW
jgi:hypothetical protein